MTWKTAQFSSCPADGWVLVHQQQQFLCAAGNPFLNPAQAAGLGLDGQRGQGVGFLRDTPVWLYDLDDQPQHPGLEWQRLRQLVQSTDVETRPENLHLLRYASQIGTWLSRHRFCGSCGQPMQPVLHERAMHCPSCNLNQYPQLSPCMIVLVTRGDEVLLARSPHHKPGLFSTLAGFVEPGETVEACVHREVMEEVGVRIHAPRYLCSQNWPFPHALMLGFHAEYAGGEIRLQPEEIEAADWFALDALPDLPMSQSISRYLIEHYRCSRQGRPLPPLPW